MIYFTSDLYLGHANIIRLCHRPFANVDEMNAALIANWNVRITNGDTVYICGDLMFRTATEPELFLRQLRGKKHLIVGNHDSSWMKKVELSKHFESVENLKIISDGRRKITLCHYPMMSFEGKYLIHGHIHNNRNDTYWKLLRSMDNALNASVELHDYTPVPFDELLQNNNLFKNADKVIPAISNLIGKLDELARDAVIRFTEVAEEIAAGRITEQSAIEWQLDHLLDYCYDAICHRLYERILGSVENKYPETVAHYKAAYNSMWVDDLPDEFETAEEILRANSAQLANHLRLDARIHGLPEYSDDELQTEVDTVRRATEKRLEQEKENEQK